MIKLIWLKLNCGGSGGGGGGGGGVVDVKLWMFIGGGVSKIGKVQKGGGVVQILDNKFWWERNNWMPPLTSFSVLGIHISLIFVTWVWNYILAQYFNENLKHQVL